MQCASAHHIDPNPDLFTTRLSWEISRAASPPEFVYVHYHVKSQGTQEYCELMSKKSILCVSGLRNSSDSGRSAVSGVWYAVLCCVRMHPCSTK